MHNHTWAPTRLNRTKSMQFRVYIAGSQSEAAN